MGMAPSVPKPSGSLAFDSAAVNAIFNATGIRKTSLPMTRDKLLGGAAMKALSKSNARSPAVSEAAGSAAAARGQAFAFVGGGTDLIQQIKDGTNQADVLINLRTVREARAVVVSPTETLIGGLITLSALAEHTALTGPWAVLREAAASVGTPQIRNAATLAGNITQRPWCWYYRNGFPCFKAGGSHCFSEHGEHQQHAIFGGGPSFSVHPSDLAPLGRWVRHSRSWGRTGHVT